MTLSCRQQRGFTLIEVLVTVIITAIGLLGIASLQLTSLKNNDSAYLRTQASLYAYEMMDMMRANRIAALNGNYDRPALTDITNIPVADNTSPIVQQDHFQWYRKLDANLPSARAAINCFATGICRVTVEWDDARAENSDIPALKQIVVAGQL
jgi:type IV pilus assembly protein PilV